MRAILTIEYEYCRVYTNYLGLQAVVERCTKNTPKQANSNPVMPMNTAQGIDMMSANAIPATTLEKWYGNDRYYISEVINASRSLLKAVVDGLFPGEHLRHAPVRTYFRIISVAIILLKVRTLSPLFVSLFVSFLSSLLFT